MLKFDELATESYNTGAKMKRLDYLPNLPRTRHTAKELFHSCLVSRMTRTFLLVYLKKKKIGIFTYSLFLSTLKISRKMLLSQSKALNVCSSPHIIKHQPILPRFLIKRYFVLLRAVKRANQKLRQ